MARFLLHLWHELGTGRALDNARRERDELDRILAAIDALAARVAPRHPDEEPLAA